MIPVVPQSEPSDFNKNVREPGLAFLKAHHITLDAAVPPGTKLQPYWRNCMSSLYSAYNGVCAYLAISFEQITGAGSVDHFVAKSALPKRCI